MVVGGGMLNGEAWEAPALDWVPAKAKPKEGMEESFIGTMGAKARGVVAEGRDEVLGHRWR